MKFDRTDFPATVPPETVDRLMEQQEARDRLHWLWIAANMIVVVGAIGATVASTVLDWPVWVRTVAFSAVCIMTPFAFFLDGRRFHHLLVEQGLRCPKCGERMFRDTWSRREQKSQRDSLRQNRCPRCLERLDDHVIAPGEPAPKLERGP